MSTSIDDFPVVNLIGDDPAPGRVLLNAPRPLYGEPVEIDVMGFTVYAPDDDRLVTDNLRLDAKRLVYTSRATVVDEMTAYVIREYGADALDGVTDDDLIATWRARHA